MQAQINTKPLEIESAKLMTKKEVNDIVNYRKKKQENLKKFTRSWFESNAGRVAELYEEIEIDANLETEFQKNQTLDKQVYWERKLCKECHGTMRFINSHRFWGCENYKKNSIERHPSLPANYGELLERELSNCKVRINPGWVTDIIYKLGMKGKIQPKELLLSLIDNGFEDLRAKYHNKTTLQSISTYEVVKKKSDQQEHEIWDTITLYPFKKVVQQQAISYRLKGEDKNRHCYIDLIVSDNSTINVIEIKNSISDIDKDQLNLYCRLVEYVNNQQKVQRRVVGVFVTFDEKNHTIKHCTYKQLCSKVYTKIGMQKLFNNNNINK